MPAMTPVLESEAAPRAMKATALIHDLNNRLSTVVGFSELLLDKPSLLDDRTTTLRYLAAIKFAGREAAQMLTLLQTEGWPAGATFPASWVTLGATVAIVGDEPPTRDATVAARSAMTILLIDDDERVRSVIADCLTGDGHQVETAEGGAQGLALLNTRRFDLVITDRAMPGMDGHLVASEVKRLAPRTAVIMLTGFGEAMRSADPKPADVDLLVSKPLTLSDLRQALATVQR
jgi:two-component system, cell cycle response regulator CpdR